MQHQQVSELKDGIYRMQFRDCDTWCVAAVGHSISGLAWFAPTNWVTGPYYDWTEVIKVELITTQTMENDKQKI